MDKQVVIKVLPGESAREGVGEEVTRLLVGDDGQYVGVVNGRIRLVDRARAIRYRMLADDVAGQIAEVKRRYGVTWVAEGAVDHDRR